MQTTTEPKSLLVLEDDDAFRGQLARAMTRRGFQSRTASSLAEALGSIKEDAPAFFIADLRLADGSGLEAIEALHRIKPAARALVLTAYGDIPAAVAAVRLGAIDCVPKTATADEIADILLTPEGERPPAPVNPISPERARQEHIEYVFHKTGENVSRSARLLNMHRRTLQRTLRRYGVANHLDVRFPDARGSEPQSENA